MNGEIELTQFPVEGLRSYDRIKARRDASMDNHIRLGFVVQPWRVEKWGMMYYGFSYSRFKTRLTNKQKAELERLKK